MRFLLILTLVVATVSGATVLADGDTQAQSQTARKTVKKKKTVKRSAKKSTAQKAVAKKTVKKNGDSRLATDFNFNDSVLHGRYQTPDEATARVENEKFLRDLLAVRTNFKDRLLKASEQN